MENSWINRFFLFLVMSPARLYRNWGVQTEMLKSILTYKLVMDDRRPNVMQATRSAQHREKEVSNATLWTMFSSFLMGLMYLIGFFIGHEYVTQLTFVFTLFIVFLSMALVSDFTAVLIDTRDNNIILPKPVNDQTIVVARLLHILIHITKLVTPMLLPTFIYLIIKAGPIAGFLFLLIAFFVVLFAIFLINSIYILILRYTTAEKFKNTIAYIQIGFAILIYGSYQIVPRLMENSQWEEFAVPKDWWMLFYPPYWFANAFNSINTLGGSPQEIFAALLAFLVPIASLYLVIKFLAPAFNQKLAMISGASGAETEVKSVKTIESSSSFAKRLSQVFCTNTCEKTGFLFAWKLMRRNRDFKVKTFPAIGYFVVLIVMMFVRNQKMNIGSDAFNNSFKPLFAIYFCIIIVTVALPNIIYSNLYKASWMFYSSPLSKPGELISGAIKAVISQFVLIIAVLAIGTCLVLGGIKTLPNIVLALSNLLLICFAVAIIGYRKLPFSKPLTEIVQGSQLVTGMGMLVISGLVGAIHFFIYKMTLAVFICIPISLTIVFLLVQSIKKTSWETLGERGFED